MTLKRDKEKARVLPWLMAKCERQRASLVAYREAFISYSGRADTVKPQTQDMIVGGTELQRHLNVQPKQVRVLFEKT